MELILTNTKVLTSGLNQNKYNDFAIEFIFCNCGGFSQVSKFCKNGFISVIIVIKFNMNFLHFSKKNIYIQSVFKKRLDFLAQF